MICLFEKTATSFDDNGMMVLDPSVCTVHEVAGGEYDLHLEHPMDETGKYLLLAGIGLAVYLFAALKVGWIPVQAGTVACICTIVGAIVLAFLIWIGFMAYNKSLADKINHALKN